MAFGLEVGLEVRWVLFCPVEGSKMEGRPLVPASIRALFRVLGTQLWLPQHALHCFWGATEKGIRRGTNDGNETVWE